MKDHRNKEHHKALCQLPGWFLGIALVILFLTAWGIAVVHHKATPKEPLFWFDQPQNQAAWKEYYK